MSLTTRSFQRRGSSKRVEFPAHPNLLQQHLRNNHLAAAGATDDSSLGSFNLESNTEHDADIDEEYRYALAPYLVWVQNAVVRSNLLVKLPPIGQIRTTNLSTRDLVKLN